MRRPSSRNEHGVEVRTRSHGREGRIDAVGKGAFERRILGQRYDYAAALLRGLQRSVRRIGQ